MFTLSGINETCEDVASLAAGAFESVRKRESVKNW